MTDYTVDQPHATANWSDTVDKEHASTTVKVENFSPDLAKSRHSTTPTLSTSTLATTFDRFTDLPRELQLRILTSSWLQVPCVLTEKNHDILFTQRAHKLLRVGNRDLTDQVLLVWYQVNTYRFSAPSQDALGPRYRPNPPKFIKRIRNLELVVDNSDGAYSRLVEDRFRPRHSIWSHMVFLNHALTPMVEEGCYSEADVRTIAQWQVNYQGLHNLKIVVDFGNYVEQHCPRRMVTQLQQSKDTYDISLQPRNLEVDLRGTLQDENLQPKDGPCPCGCFEDLKTLIEQKVTKKRGFNDAEATLDE